MNKTPELGEYKYPYPLNPSIKSNLNESNGFIVEFEGLDGSGKSTQVKLLCEYLQKKNKKVWLGNFIHSEYMKDILLKTKYYNCDPYTFALMYTMGLTNFYNTEVVPKLQEGYIVILDRYIYTIYSKALIKNVDRKWLDGLLRIFRLPNLCIFVDCDPNESLNRKLKTDKILSYWECGCDMEDDNLRFSYDHEKYKKNYLKYQQRIRVIYLNKLNNNQYVVNGNRDVKKINNEIINIIDNHIGDKYEQ